MTEEEISTLKSIEKAHVDVHKNAYSRLAQVTFYGTSDLDYRLKRYTGDVVRDHDR